MAEVNPGEWKICWYDYDYDRRVCRTVERYDKILNWLRRYNIYNEIARRLKPGTYYVYLVANRCGPSSFGFICRDVPTKLDDLNQLWPCDYMVVGDGRVFVYLCDDRGIILDPRILITPHPL